LVLILTHITIQEKKKNHVSWMRRNVKIRVDSLYQAGKGEMKDQD